MDEIIIIEEKPKKIYNCIHNKRKTYCKECGGSQICEHNKDKSRCKECGGSQICEHNKDKSRCKECGGSSICEHGKFKQYCKECGGSQICEHNKHRSGCKECKGGSICKHDKQKSYCKECKGGSICEHDKQKSYCKECKGSQICEHNKIKSVCKDCKGSQVCKHDKQKSYCKECKGSQVCIHNKIKSCCKECGGSGLCKSPYCEIRGYKKYNGYCLRCCIYNCPEIAVIHNYKTKENEVVSRIKESFPDFDWIHDKKVEDGCSRRRPDLLCDMGSHIVIIEVDENKHSDYDCSCENKRLMEISRDLGHRPIIFIRFNPDGYTTSEGEVIKSCWRVNGKGIMAIISKKKDEWKSRIESLKEQIKYWIENPSEKTIEIVELFY
jgi:hypothetical protein